MDGGGSLFPRRADAPAQDAQRRVKAMAVLDSWLLIGLDGVALSGDDWRLGREELTRRASAGLPVLAANLVCDGVRPFPASRVVERGGWRVGLVGVTAGAVEGCAIDDPLEAARAALAALDDVDVRVLLAPVSAADQRRMSEAQLPLDFVVDPSGRTDAIPPPWGGGYALAAGSRGKQVGVATFIDAPGRGPWLADGIVEQLERDRDRLVERRDSARERAATTTDEPSKARLAKQSTAYEAQITAKDLEIAAAKGAPGAAGRRFSVVLHPLDAEVGDHAPTAAIVAEALASLGPVTAATIPRRVAPGGAFVGADACALCHAAETAQWSTTPHADAWASLVSDGHAADADCTACHATGVGLPGGPTGPADVGALRDVQCEACHGAAAAHVADPAVGRLTRDPPMATCLACHDGERDGGRFESASYHARVVHRATTSLQR